MTETNLNQRNKYNVFWLFLIKQHIPETCKSKNQVQFYNMAIE